MSFKYEDYNSVDGIKRFGEIAQDFDFGPNLPRASFPESFVRAYVNQFEGVEDDDYDNVFFKIFFPDFELVAMLESIDTPRYIHSQNCILAESIYAEKDSQIMPPGLYSFGTCLDDRGHIQLMVNLDSKSEKCGQIFAWRRAHDALGTGDNTTAVGFVAHSFKEFLDSLGPEH